MDTSGGINHEQLIKRSQGSEQTEKGKRYSVIVNGLFSEHFDVKTNKRSVETRDCDNILVVVIGKMYIDTFVCIPSHNIFVITSPSLIQNIEKMKAK